MPHGPFSTVGPRALIRAKHVTEIQRALLNTPSYDDLPSAFAYQGRVDAFGDLPSVGNTDGDLYVVGTGSTAVAYLWDTDAWVSLGPVTMGAPGEPGADGADGQGSVYLDNALGAAYGFVLGDGQVTHTTGGDDGLPIPAAVDLLVEAFERDGVTLGGGGGAVESVNGQTGAVVLDADDLADGSGKVQMTAAERTKLAGIPVEGSQAGAGLIHPDRYAAPRIIDINAFVTVGSSVATTWDTYDGGDVVVHPTIRFFPEGWNGYQWWACAMPYLASNTLIENPSIFVSLNGTDWFPPPGVTNPLEPKPANDEVNHDNSITVGPDGTMYLIYGTWDAVTKDESIDLISSTDGIDWTPTVRLFEEAATDRELLSPNMWWDVQAGQWVMLVAKWEAAKFLRRYTAANPFGPWTEGANVTISPAFAAGSGIWHFDAFPMGSQVVCIAGAGAALDELDTWLLVSNDSGKTFTRPTAAVFTTGDSYHPTGVPILTERGLGFDIIVGWHNPWGADRITVARTLA